MITVLGSKGFIGSHFVERLNALGIGYQAPSREENLNQKDLGTIIYCIGLTADFRTRPLDTVEAHVCKLLEVLRNCRYEKIVYLSSTRIYDTTSDVAEEEGAFRVLPGNPGDLYNISKIMGEAMIRSLGKRSHIVRLSNVYGRDDGANNFLSSIIRDAVTLKRVALETSMDSEKDYISVGDVVALLLQIAERGSRRIYNVASGVNLSNRQITDKLAALTNCKVEVMPEARTIKFPRINIDAIRTEFGYTPSGLLDEMQKLVDPYLDQNGE